jgi:hypothetical protein
LLFAASKCKTSSCGCWRAMAWLGTTMAAAEQWLLFPFLGSGPAVMMSGAALLTPRGRVPEGGARNSPQ